jgi:hypothetical protein
MSELIAEVDQNRLDPRAPLFVARRAPKERSRETRISMDLPSRHAVGVSAAFADRPPTNLGEQHHAALQ